ncbi:tetraacyldisaccharide 4'-kinase, partial [Flavobacteriales bacterium]|nr:tetraacyldisaccharide 4'-kinase [Flavobacteriales bacterium]
MVKAFRYLLLPISFLYGLIVGLRNVLFNNNILKSSEFDVKTILVGNIAAGGTGKTPHVEYLIRLLSNKKLATLSRGYGR